MEYRFSDKIKNVRPSVIREILKSTNDPNLISFAAGNPATESLPVDAIAAITADILKTEPALALQYSVTEGYTPLREAIRERLKTHYGIGGDGDDLLVVSGAQQGIDLTSHCLLNDGDKVLAENPSFIGSLNTFRSYHAELIGVPLQPDGIDLDALEAAIGQNPTARFLYTIPTFQNPTGITMSLEKRRALYALALRHELLILEDNPYSNLRFSGEDLPTLKSMDTEGIVIYCGTFSKILSPGLRVGFIVAPKPIISRMTVAKQCSDVHTSILPQLICYRFMRDYDLDAHIAGFKEIYLTRSAAMLSGMEAHFAPGITWTHPDGGLFVWCTLPENIDMLDFCRRGVENLVAAVPGTAFLTDENARTNSFRMNYSTPSLAQIQRGVEILGRLSREYA